MANSKKSEEKSKITLDLNILQTGDIKVHSQIINDLSSGIYSSPASCVKELINNSYDADATEVVIRVKPIDDSITIIDDGNGMNAKDFDNNFAWISKSNKRNNGARSPKLNRPLIGKIGIGFIAVNEICEELEITSTKKDEPWRFTAKINFKDYYQTETIVDGGIIKGAYTLINEDEEPDEHYTIIRLLGLKPSVRDVLDDRQYFSELARTKHPKNFDRNYFENMSDLLNHHFDKGLKSFTEDNSYIQFIIDLASYIPVEYLEEGPTPGKRNKIINELVELHKDLNFKVDLDGIFLKKPIYFPNAESSRVISFSEEIPIEDTFLKFKGYFYIKHGLIEPRELNGIAIRIRNIPIAERFGYDTTFLSYPNYMDQIWRNWVSGEIYIDQGLEDAMNIDRKSFRVTHPHYLALQNYLHKFLKNKVFKITSEIYEAAKEERTVVAKKATQEDRKKILKTKQVVYQKTTTRSDAKKAKKKNISPITIVKSSSLNAVVEVDESAAKQFKKKDWAVLENVFLIFELAYNESKGNAEKLKELFYQKINEWKDIN